MLAFILLWAQSPAPAPAAAPPTTPRAVFLAHPGPVEDFAGERTLNVRATCRFVGVGDVDCTLPDPPATGRLIPDAAQWMAGMLDGLDEAPLMERTGAQVDITVAFRPGGTRSELVGRPVWSNWWPRIETPRWITSPQDADVAVAYGVVAPRDRTSLRLSLLCPVLADGRLNGCVPQPPDGHEDPPPSRPMSRVVDAVTASLQLAPAEANEPPAGPRSVRVSLRLTPPPSAQAYVYQAPRVISTSDPAVAQSLTPPAFPVGTMSGEVEVLCVAGVSGRLDSCLVASEAPRGYGLGDASLALAELVRVAPATVNGRPLRAGVRQRFRW